MTDPNLPDRPPPPPGVAGPSYNEQVPQYPAPAVGQPAYGVQPPVYQFPYQQKQGLGTGAKVGIGVGIGCLVLVVIPVILFLIFAAVSISAMGNSTTEYNSPATSTPDPDTGDFDEAPVAAESPETDWKSGDDWYPAPADSEAQPGAFLPGYQTPEEWLATTGTLPDGFDIVFTSDPTYNCGLSKAPKDADWVVGCYNPDYGNTLFLWWGPDAVDDMKQLILLHEYSHYYQNWTNFDSMYSASLAGLYDDDAFRADVWETDATCRVYYDWGFTNLQYLDSYTVSPCGATDWSDAWFEEQLEARGVTVEDW